MRDAYEVVVVGGGIVGLAIAWRARRRGFGVLVVERDHLGAGASGVAAGMLAPVSEADFGEGALLSLNLAGLERWPAFAAELSERSGVDLGLRFDGGLLVAADADDARQLARLTDLHESLGLDTRRLSGRECRRLEPGLSPRVAGGIEAPHEGHVDPEATVRALRAAFRAEGGEIRESRAVERLEIDGDAASGVVLSNGETVDAERVVLAAGAWSSAPGGAEGPPVRPVKGQILTLRLPDGHAPLASRLVRTPRCYVVPRPDGRVVVGATTEERGFNDRVTAEGVFRLLEAAREVLPETDELELVEARAGLRPGTPDNRPVIGPGGLEGLTLATGHGRNGVLLAPITAEAVVALLEEREPPCDLTTFGASRFASAGATATVPAN